MNNMGFPRNQAEHICRDPVLRSCVENWVGAGLTPINAYRRCTRTSGHIGDFESEDPRDTYGDGEECVKCHVQLWDQAMQKFYVHQPFFPELSALV